VSTNASTIGTVVTVAGYNDYVLAPVDKKFLFVNVSDGSYIEYVPTFEIYGDRWNDGKCDTAGRLWVGTIDYSQNNLGALYRLDPDLSLYEMVPNVSISNGIIWSLNNTIMYYIDTVTQRVDAFDYNVTTGNISNRRTVIEIPISLGSPDGMTIDANGNLWIAMFNGWMVTQWNPNNGTLLNKIKLSSSQVTSCAFGNTLLDTLYITTFRNENINYMNQPFSGSLFSVKIPNVTGVPANCFSGNIPSSKF